MSKAFVLLSGGIDSSTCLFIARAQFKEVIAISIDYGQRHVRELHAAADVAGYAGCEHHKVKGPEMPQSMLTDPSQHIPNISYSEIQGISPTYVPFRNGMLLSYITAIASAQKADAVFFGAHAEDAHNWAYPDCTPEFIGAMANAIFIGTYMKTRLYTPLEWLGKREIIKLGDSLCVPFHLTWSCYAGGQQHCGTCPTCRARHQGFEDAGIPDPTEYAQPFVV